MSERRAKRLVRLEQALAGAGTLRLAEAARLCEVSEMTVRRDVAASQGRLALLGGRLVRSDDPRFASAYDLEEQQGSHFPAKRRLCARAADFVADGDTLFIDCGTTLMPLVAQLGPFREITVVTYALNVANAVTQLPGVRLVLLGGLYHAASRSFGDEAVAEAIARLGINRAFLSAGGVAPRQGVSCFHFHEVAPKQAAIAVAGQRILVVDASKLGVVRPARFAALEELDVLVTEGPAGERLAEALAASEDGPRVVLA
jgi:DeoR family transcriptional regulator, deoxyribose operon repressor